MGEQLARNRHRQKVSAHAKHPSLFAGLVTTSDGRRLIASHAVRRGKRYRYYRSPRAAAEETSRPEISIASEPLEGAVLSVLTRHLRDQSWLLGVPDAKNDPRQVLERAAFFASELESTDPIARRGAMLTLAKTVRVDSNAIEVEFDLAALAQCAVDTADRTVTLHEPVVFTRRGREPKIVIPASGPVDPEPDPALVKALAQAHRWWLDLTSGRFENVRVLASAYDTHERYVGFVLRLAFLSPDLTKQILSGTQPPHLTAHRLLKGVEVPACWREQALLK